MSNSNTQSSTHSVSTENEIMDQVSSMREQLQLDLDLIKIPKNVFPKMLPFLSRTQNLDKIWRKTQLQR